MSVASKSAVAIDHLGAGEDGSHHPRRLADSSGRGMDGARSFRGRAWGSGSCARLRPTGEQRVACDQPPRLCREGRTAPGCRVVSQPAAARRHQVEHAADKWAAMWSAFQQRQIYQAVIPSLVAFNAALVTWDGWAVHIGALTIGFKKYVGEAA